MHILFQCKLSATPHTSSIQHYNCPRFEPLKPTGRCGSFRRPLQPGHLRTNRVQKHVWANPLRTQHCSTSQPTVILTTTGHCEYQVCHSVGDPSQIPTQCSLPVEAYGRADRAGIARRKARWLQSRQRFYSDFWLNHHQNLGFELLLDQFCAGQAYNSFEGILQNKKQK